MSVRRWIGVGGIAVAVAAGAAATVGGGGPEFEAQVSVRMPGPPALRDERTRLLDEPDVRGLVHLRLGETLPLRVTAAGNDLFLVRVRGATPRWADDAARTYAASYVDVRRRQSQADLSAAAEPIRGKIAQLESQLTSAVGPQRASLVDALELFTERLDELHVDQSLQPGTEVVGFTPAEPVDHGARREWAVAALGAGVGFGAAVSARRARTGGRATKPAPLDGR